MYQTQHSVEASRQPGNSPFGLAMSAGGWGILFSSLLILLQLGLLYLLRGNYTLASRNSSLLVVFAALELTCSFCAALLAAGRTGRIASGIFAGMLVGLLSGITDLYLSIAAWRTVLARIHSLILEGQARQAIGRSFVELLVSLLLCVGISILGALLGDHLGNRPSTRLTYSPSGSGGSLPPSPGPPTANGFPQTPTPNGWRFGPYDYSQTGRSNPDMEVNQWVYSSPASPPPPPPAAPIGTTQPRLHQFHPGDTPTLPGTGSAPTELLRSSEDTSLPLPYSGRDSRRTQN